MIATSQFARTSAAVGGLIWIAALLIQTGDSPETDLIQKIFLLAVFVIVPLALSLISPNEDSIALRIAAWAQPGLPSSSGTSLTRPSRMSITRSP